MSDFSTHEILVRAKAYLLEHGWKQSSFGAHGGPRCILGAVGSVTNTDLEEASYPLPFEEALEDAFGFASGGIPEWNDEPGRTFEQVVAALDRAIIATAPEAKPEDALTAQETIDALSPLAFIPAGALV